jgi:uncharacterized protein (DUF2267 family)
MPQSPVAAFETTMNKTHEWLKEMAEAGGLAGEPQAYSALRAVLHSIRDRLTVDEATHLGAQLPMLVRGFYFEGWKPAQSPNRERTWDEFVMSVRESLRGNPMIDPERAIEATFKVLDKRITIGEINDIKRMLPQEIREHWVAAPA